MKNLRYAILTATAIFVFHFQPALAQSAFPNPLSYGSIQEILQSVMRYLQQIIATICVAFIIIGGLIYMMSSGNEKMIERAKACVTAAVVGLVITLAAPSFLGDIQSVLGAQNRIQAPGLIDIAGRALTFLLSILGTVAVISLVLAGGMYLFSTGDEKRIETAKSMFTYSLIGIVIAWGSLVIVKQVMTIIGT